VRADPQGLTHGCGARFGERPSRGKSGLTDAVEGEEPEAAPSRHSAVRALVLSGIYADGGRGRHGRGLPVGRGVYRPADKLRLCPGGDRRKLYRSLFCDPLDIQAFPRDECCARVRRPA
jgi:hypothetical protein